LIRSFSSKAKISPRLQPVNSANKAGPNGPWTDLGYVFSESGREFWHGGEEADPKIIFIGEKAYLLFAGWDGLPSIIQRIGIVKLSTENYKAMNSSMVLANPEEVWHQRNSTIRIFSPIYLDTDGQQRIFYSQNPNAAVTAGWGYLSPSEQSQNGSEDYN